MNVQLLFVYKLWNTKTLYYSFPKSLNNYNITFNISLRKQNIILTIDIEFVNFLVVINRCYLKLNILFIYFKDIVKMKPNLVIL